jgi:hypothetical protein
MSRDRVHRNATQEPHLLGRTHTDQLTLNKCLQVRGETLVPHFHPDEVAVCRIFVTVDGVARVTLKSSRKILK